jgi:hypothetical protein
MDEGKVGMDVGIFNLIDLSMVDSDQYSLKDDVLSSESILRLETGFKPRIQLAASWSSFVRYNMYSGFLGYTMLDSPRSTLGLLAGLSYRKAESSYHTYETVYDENGDQVYNEYGLPEYTVEEHKYAFYSLTSSLGLRGSWRARDRLRLNYMARVSRGRAYAIYGVEDDQSDPFNWLEGGLGVTYEPHPRIALGASLAELLLFDKTQVTYSQTHLLQLSARFQFGRRDADERLKKANQQKETSASPASISAPISQPSGGNVPAESQLQPPAPEPPNPPADVLSNPPSNPPSSMPSHPDAAPNGASSPLL